MSSGQGIAVALALFVAVSAASGAPPVVPAVAVPARWLRSGDARLAGRGAEMLARGGADGVVALLSAADDLDPKVRRAALTAMAEMETPPEGVFDAAVRALDDPEVASAGVYVLARHPRPLPNAVPRLLTYIRESAQASGCSPYHSEMMALAHTTRGHPELLEAALRSPDARTRYVVEGARRAAGLVRDEAPAAPRRHTARDFSKALTDDDPERRAHALRELHADPLELKQPVQDPLGGDRALLDAVRRCLGDRNPHVRGDALGALRRLAPADETLATLTRSLSDRAWSVRRSAAYELAWIGPGAASAVPALRPLLRDRDEDVRRGAAFALGRIGVADPAVIADLTRMARADRTESHEAFEALGRLAPGSAETRALVLAALRARPHRHFDAALGLAGRLARSDPAILAAVVVTLPGPDDRWRHESALKAIGAPAVPALIARLADPDDGVAQSAAEALVAIGEPARPALAAALRTSSPRARRWAGVATLKLDRSSR